LCRAKSLNTKHLHESSMQSRSVDSETTAIDDRYTHLSAFAVNGRDGSIRWHHVIGDFEKRHTKVTNIYSEELLLRNITTVHEMELCSNM